jgi:hypothetical protein
MYGAVAVGALNSEVVRAQRELHSALEEQERALDAVLSLFTEARLLLPANTDNGWRGLAQLFYRFALDRLRADLNHAHEHLRTALHDTRQAANTLVDHAG